MRDLAHRVWNKLSPGRDYITEAEIPASEAQDLIGNSELGRLVLAHDGRTIWKWAHYLDLYDKHFSAFRNKPLRFLEIGVWKGGSLELWRKYFGPDAVIFGIDIDRACADFVDSPNQVRIGSQDDPQFLRSVIEEMGGVDIVLDDGSHMGKHQRASFEALFPLLSNGGLYAIEDLHTSYWPGLFRGGYQRRGTGTEFIKSLIDDLHGWWHRRASRDDLAAIHIYDSIAFIEKAARAEPKLLKTAAPLQ